MGTLKGMLVPIIALLGIVVVGAYLFFTGALTEATGNSAAPTKTPTVAPAPTNTTIDTPIALATDTVKPTDTSVPIATDTEVPTNTPTNTPTEIPTDTPIPAGVHEVFGGTLIQSGDLAVLIITNPVTNTPTIMLRGPIIFSDYTLTYHDQAWVGFTTVEEANTKFDEVEQEIFEDICSGKYPYFELYVRGNLAVVDCSTPTPTVTQTPTLDPNATYTPTTIPTDTPTDTPTETPTETPTVASVGDCIDLWAYGFGWTMGTSVEYQGNIQGDIAVPIGVIVDVFGHHYEADQVIKFNDWSKQWRSVEGKTALQVTFWPINGTCLSANL